MKLFLLFFIFTLSANAALIKTYTNGLGVQGNYWKVTKVQVDKVRGKMQCEITNYINEAHADQNKGRLINKDYTFDASGDDFTSNPIATCYNKIKAKYVNPAPSPAKQPSDKDLLGAIDG